MITSQIGIQLRRTRRKAGLTQAELARRMGTSQPAVARAESGLVQPTLDFVDRFVRVTGEPLRIGSLLLLPAEPANVETERTERIRRAVGDYEFNPWQRDPSPSEARSLEADGLTRERFERESSPRPRSR